MNISNVFLNVPFTGEPMITCRARKLPDIKMHHINMPHNTRETAPGFFAIHTFQSNLFRMRHFQMQT